MVLSLPSLISRGDTVEITYVPQDAKTETHWVFMKTIVRDRLGNVSEYFYKVSHLLVRERHYTGRANPTLRTTETENRPTGKLRPDDPEFYETRYEYNADYSRVRTIHPNGNITENVYEADIYANAPVRTRQNLRIVRHLPGDHTPAGDQSVITEQYEYDAGFGCPACGFNFVTKNTDGRGNSILSQYDEHGNLLARTNRIASIVDRYEYNARGQMTKHIHPDNGSGSKL